MRTSVICLSHARGSAGQEVGRLLAERLGFRYVDEEIIFTAADADHMYPEAVSLAESRNAGRRLEVDFNRFEPTGAVRELIHTAIVETAEEGNVVIVAHAASFTLAEREGVLRVHVTGSPDNRLQRLAEDEGFDTETAAQVLDDSDKDRKAYVKEFHGVAHELPTHYDLVVNTDRLSTEQAVEAIVNAASS